MRALDGRIATGIGIGTAVGILVALTTLAAPSPIPWEHYVCVPGDVIATQYNWTPSGLLDSPYGGWGFGQ